MIKRWFIFFLIFDLIFLSMISPSIFGKDQSWWDEDWSFKQEIIIPFDQTNYNTSYQPIDIYVDFNNPCWAKNTEEHSVRVILEKDNKLKEIESQIYDLKYCDE
jgi:hypothetical protein